MRLTIQKTENPGSLVSDAYLEDIRELLLGIEDETDADTAESSEDESADEETVTRNDIRSGFDETFVSESIGNYTIELSAPGFHQDDFLIEVSEDGVLVVNAWRESTAHNQIDSVRSIEVLENKASRSFRLPDDADCDRIQAMYTDDLLTITVGKTASEL